jgi:hypothetical protein
MKNNALAALSLLTLAVAASSCSGLSDSASPESKGTDNKTSTATAIIEEPDLYQRSGNYLYVQNQQTGLNILDLTNLKQPKLLGRAGVTGGAGAEMYLEQKSLAVLLLKTATAACQPLAGLDPGSWSFGMELALVDTADKASPKVLGRHCLPGKLVASRTVDGLLYVVTYQENAQGSRAVSIDLSDPKAPRLIDRIEFPSASKEITVTSTAIWVAGSAAAANTTHVQYISLAKDGKMTARGSVPVRGLPQGRFHQADKGSLFRIVTYNADEASSELTILDFTNPDAPKTLGSLPGIGGSEKLYATRFDGDFAYVVTYQEVDPLWVISLKDPTNPEIVGQLEVPGWSDYLFPRSGNRLLAVGRSFSETSIALSYFDVSDPSNPRRLSTVTLSNESDSAALVDHRAVTVVEATGKNPLVVIPHTNYATGANGCQRVERLRLVEISGDQLKARGVVDQKGTIRRSFATSDLLFSITDYEVASVDISDRDAPVVASRVTVGTEQSLVLTDTSYCPVYMKDGVDVESHHILFCALAAPGGSLRPDPSLFLGVLVLLGLHLLRRRRGA